jgi:hypothetical protein
MTREEQFKEALKNLKTAYIENMNQDLSKGFDLDLIEMDGFQGYLMIANNYQDVLNKEEILSELGFSIDMSAHKLKLNSNKGKTFSKGQMFVIYS